MTDDVLAPESAAADATDAPARYRRAEAAMWAEHGAPGPRERWVEVAASGTRVRVLEHGEGPPVLFVHGCPNAASTWAPIVGRLWGFEVLEASGHLPWLDDPAGHAERIGAFLREP